MDEKKELNEDELHNVTGGSASAYVPPSWRNGTAAGGLAVNPLSDDSTITNPESSLL